MLRFSIKRIQREIKPKIRNSIYDYTQTEPENPHRPVVESEVLLPNENLFSSFSVALGFYVMGAYLVFFFTKLRYDKEWDRHYHIYYPAGMEYFDKAVDGFNQKKSELAQMVPRSLSDVYSEYLAKNSSGEKNKNPNDGVKMESKLAAEVSKFLETEGNGNND